MAGIGLDDVSDEQRARAKAVNFGIIYGSSAFGLSQTLGIAAGEAQETINAYFARYEGVRRFLDETVERAKKDGCVRTLFGRRRNLPDLSSRNRVLRQAAERMATNTVIQGTAADLIKKAMIDIDRALSEEEIDATMILQVHDELVFETTEKVKAALSAMVKERMEGVAPLAGAAHCRSGFGQELASRPLIDDWLASRRTNRGVYDSGFSRELGFSSGLRSFFATKIAWCPLPIHKSRISPSQGCPKRQLGVSGFFVLGLLSE